MSATPAADTDGGPALPRSIPHLLTSPRPPGLIRKFVALLGPDFGLTLAFLGALAALVALFGASFVWTQGPILIAAGILASLIGIALARRVPAILRGDPGAWRDFAAA